MIERCICFIIRMLILVISKYTVCAPPPSLSYQFVHGSHMQHIDKLGHVAAAPGPDIIWT